MAPVLVTLTAPEMVVPPPERALIAVLATVMLPVLLTVTVPVG
jgi:hypothetical protein